MPHLMGLAKGEFHPAIADALGRDEKPPVMEPWIAHQRHQANEERTTANRPTSAEDRSSVLGLK